ncbi:MAG: hypothetical protein ACP5D2_04035 [Candidatus Nanoarchaeia archaeon]
MTKKYLGTSPPLLDQDLITKGYLDTQISNISLNDLLNVNTSPSDGDALIWNSLAEEWQAGTVSGDLSGPASSSDNAVARYNGIDGKILQNSGIIIDDDDNISGVASILLGNYKIEFNSIETSLDITYVS